MANFTAKFRDRVLLYSQYMADEEMKKMRYHEMFRDVIHEFVSLSGCKKLEDMISRALEVDIYLDHLKKKKSIQV